MLKMFIIKLSKTIGQDTQVNIQISSHGNSSSRFNRMKARINEMKYNRNPFFLSKREAKRFRDRIGSGVRRQLKGSDGAYRRALKAASDSLVYLFKEHIDTGKFEKPRKPLTAAYKKWKEKKYPGKPILRLTDDLYNSLNARIKKK